MAKIFISHAVADKELVDAFTDFLQTGCGVKIEDIFCSSLEGMNIPEGSNFVDVIQESLKDAAFVIMIITPSYYESVFCLCELGAAWILQHNSFPLVVPPLTFGDLRAVLSPLQSGVINNSEDLANLLDRLRQIGLTQIATARFGLKRDAFIEKFRSLTIKGRTNVSAKEHEALQAKYNEALQATIESEAEVAKWKKRFEELVPKKDKDDVAAIILSDSAEPEAFDSLIKAFRDDSRRLPRTALEALFKEVRGEQYCLPQSFGNEQIHYEAEKAAEKEIIKKDDNLVTLVDSHPLVSEAKTALKKLSAFMKGASGDFTNSYISKNKHQFSIHNRDFWRSNLGL